MTGPVVHLSFSSHGGAGRVASQLSSAQAKTGIESALVIMTDSNLFAAPLKNPVHTVAAATDNYVLRKRGFPSLVSITRSLLHAGMANATSAAEVIHLHWAPGFVDLTELATIARNKRIVWTLHDMNPFTGGCHQSMGCENFVGECEKCPAVRKFARPAIQKTLEQKVAQYSHFSNMSFVAPTPWIGRAAADSAALRNMKIDVIPNPVENIFFSNTWAKMKQKSPPYFTVIAADHNDPLKNVLFVLSAFAEFRKTHPEFRLHLIGKNAPKYTAREGILAFDYLQKEDLVAHLANSTGLLIPSLAETGSLVAVEAAAVGTPFIGNDIPALRELSKLLGQGRIAKSPAEWVTAMVQAAGDWGSGRLKSERPALITTCREQFHEDIVSKQYVRVYEEKA